MLQVVVAQFSGMAVIMDKRERMRSFVPTQRNVSLLYAAFGLLLDWSRELSAVTSVTGMGVRRGGCS